MFISSPSIFHHATTCLMHNVCHFNSVSLQWTLLARHQIIFLQILSYLLYVRKLSAHLSEVK
jgi:hypothetical protein